MSDYIHHFYKGKIIENKPVSQRFFLLRIQTASDFFDMFTPGKFCMLQISDTFDPLLNRPFSISYADPSNRIVLILYQIVGKGTRLLSLKKTGDTLSISPPLGNGFPQTTLESTTLFLLGGGIGIAPLLSVYSYWQALGKNIPLFWGIRDKHDYFDIKLSYAFKNLQLFLSTEDGSLGQKGTVLDLLTAHMKDKSEQNITVFACGPLKMLCSLNEWCNGRRVDLYLSIESRMACGVGFCMGCALPSSRGNYVRACQEGPVFHATSLSWEHIHDLC